jgi:hypothetical protein
MTTEKPVAQAEPRRDHSGDQPPGGAVEHRPAEPVGRPMKQVDFVVGVGFVLFGLVVFWAARDLAVRADSAPGPGLLPKALAIVFVVAGGLLAAKQFVRPSTGAAVRAGSAGNTRVLAVFVLMTVTVVVFEPLGFILATTLLLAGLLFGVERKFTAVAAATVLLLPSALWALFAVLLGVRLPTGLLYF